MSEPQAAPLVRIEGVTKRFDGVTAVDGVLVARSAFESALLYRSAVLFGQFAPVSADELSDALDIMTDRILPGRVAELRRPTAKELAATLVLAVPLCLPPRRRTISEGEE